MVMKNVEIDNETPQTTTIQVTTKTRDQLNKLKVHPREPYDDVIKRLLDKTEALS